MQRVKLLAAWLGVALLPACRQGDYVTSTFVNSGAQGPGVTIVGSGVPATELRTLPGFTAVSVTAPFRVVMVAGDSSSLEVTADDNVLRFVSSEVRGDRLFLSFTTPVSLVRVRQIVCRLTVGEIREAEGTGAAAIEMDAVDADRLSVRLTGASSGRANGTARELTLALSGASRWDASGLHARSASGAISGSSYALQRVSDSLRADVSGSSTLEYLGDPLVVTNVSGSSVVRRIGP